MKKLLFFVLLFCQWMGGSAAEWQWRVGLNGFVSAETGKAPNAFLWIPADCERVRAVMVGQHNMSEETLFENVLFRNRMAEQGVALVWISPILDMAWDVTNGCQQVFDRMLGDLAAVSGYAELEWVPVIPIGHSACATYPWNFAAWNPERTLAVISLHGDAPRTNLTGYGGANLEWGRTRNIDGIPGLMIEGEYEWWEARVTPALAFRMMYPQSCVSFLCDAGRGHFDLADETADYIARFIEKALEWRLPERTNVVESMGGNTSAAEKQLGLRPLNPTEGWLAERWRQDGRKRAKAAPWAKYKGDRHDAFWYFDEEMAMLAEQRIAKDKGKAEQYIGFLQKGQLVPFDVNLHARMKADWLPEADGLTFHLHAVYTDTLRSVLSDKHAAGHPVFSRICGPVEVVDDTTFRVKFYYMGMDNPRRTPEIWLFASHPGDTRYGSSVQQLLINIPYRNREGVRQHILFPGLPDIPIGTTSMELNATSDCGLPVSYYVKEGPAVIEEGKVVLTKIPPRARYPMKVTVVAWQYGLAGKVQTAEPVERSFFIHQ